MNETSMKDPISMPATADASFPAGTVKIDTHNLSIDSSHLTSSANEQVAANSSDPKYLESTAPMKLTTSLTTVKSYGHQFALPSPPPAPPTTSTHSNQSNASSVIKIQASGPLNQPKIFLTTQGDLTITPKQKVNTHLLPKSVLSMGGQTAVPSKQLAAFKKHVRLGRPPIAAAKLPVLVNMSKDLTMVRQGIPKDGDASKTVISKKQTPSITITTKLLPNTQGSVVSNSTFIQQPKVLTVADLIANKKIVGAHLTPNITLTLANTTITSTPTMSVAASGIMASTITTSMSEQPKLIFSNAFRNRHHISSETDNSRIGRMVNFQISNGKLSDSSIRLMLPKPVTPPPDNPLANISILNGILTANSSETSRTLVSLSPPKTTSISIEPPSTPTRKQTINITNGQLSNPNGPIKLLAGSPISKQASQTAARNKLIDTLKQSPRTLKRSRSLQTPSDDIAGKRKRNRARLPSDSFGVYKPRGSYKPRTNFSAHKSKPLKIPEINIEESDLSSICSSLFDSLECPEKLDEGISNTSKSIIPIEAQPVARTEAIKPVSNQIDDPIKCLKWRKAIGYMCFSDDLHFKTNEFNLIDIMDEADLFRNHIDQQFERQINEEGIQMVAGVAYKRVQTPRVKQEPILITTTPPQNVGSNGLPILSTVRGLSTAMARSFSWELYFKLHNGRPAPLNLFINPYPTSSNMFEVGMKLEAIDPEHASLFCVCTIVERIGYRIKLHFDGYSTKFDFWKNVDSLDIFPPGWCARTNRQLEPPAGYDGRKFDWQRYLDGTLSLAAPRQYFTHLNSSGTAENPFRVGMKLEADDLKNSRKVCVASVIDVLDNRVLISFDGWDDAYDYWTDVSSPYIHPINWHQWNNMPITCPPDLSYNFTWERYLALTGSVTAPANIFNSRQPMGFEIGMKFEIVDEKNPTLIRPATVISVRGYSLQVLFDGWPTNYQFWTEDDNPDIHPINWCQKTEHPLEPPPPNADTLIFKAACGVLGCREIGNAKNPDSNTHKCLVECPYESRNWANDNADKSARLSSLHRVRKSLKRRSIYAVSSQSASVIPASKRRIKLEAVSSEDSNSSSVQPLMTTCDVIATPSVEYHMKEETIVDVHNEEDNIADTVVVPNVLPVVPIKQKRSVPNTDIEKNLVTEKDLKLKDYTTDLLSDYGPSRLWKKHSEILECMMMPPTLNEFSAETVNPMCWNANEVFAYINRLPKCRSYANIFLEQEIDGPALLSLTHDDLISILKLRIGPSIKISNQIVCLRDRVSSIARTK